MSPGFSSDKRETKCHFGAFWVMLGHSGSCWGILGHAGAFWVCCWWQKAQLQSFTWCNILLWKKKEKKKGNLGLKRLILFKSDSCILKFILMSFSFQNIGI